LPNTEEKKSSINVTKLLEQIPNKFLLCVAASRRARQIKDNLHQSGVLETDPIVPVLEALKEIQEGRVKVFNRPLSDEIAEDSLKSRIHSDSKDQNSETSSEKKNKDKDSKSKKSKSLAA